MTATRRFLITGGCGFIGSAMVRYLFKHTSHHIINLDKLTYAANSESLGVIGDSDRYDFKQLDIVDYAALNEAVAEFQPDVVMHFAAESHVDRSIDSAHEFIYTNYVGTFNLLEACRHYYQGLDEQRQSCFRFHHISTDEVYGSRRKEDMPSTEQSLYDPSSPYAASKAGADHLVRAWFKTYGLPVILSNCSNNYGPWQYPEKLIPVTINNAIAGKAIPLYGNGEQIRDWLHVEDHVKALFQIATAGTLGQSYNVGGDNELSNIEVVTMICDILDRQVCDKPNGISSFANLITYVSDRPGHDIRYAINADKLKQELNWRSEIPFVNGLEQTVKWYLKSNQSQ